MGRTEEGSWNRLEPDCVCEDDERHEPGGGRQRRREGRTMMNAMQESPAHQAPPYVQAAPTPPPQARLRDTRSKSAALAAVLSMMPGLGQVYVGYYQRGFVHAAVVATLVTILASGTLDRLNPLLALFLSLFWLYNIIYTARPASP